jgi:hypothetical protein
LIWRWDWKQVHDGHSTRWRSSVRWTPVCPWCRSWYRTSPSQRIYMPCQCKRSIELWSNQDLHDLSCGAY